MGMIVGGAVSADVPAGVPLIGYQNLTTISNITSTTEAASYPATNLANPATHLRWQAGVNTGDELITIAANAATPIDYVAVAGHNWASIEATVSIETTASPPVALTTPETLDDNQPIIFRFVPQVLSAVRIRIAGASGVPQAAVVYVGKLLVLERSIKIGANHVPISYGRRTNMVNGMSESANFLGRIVLGEHRESTAEFEWFTPDFYRSDIDAFLAAAQETPFFWAWSPTEYPAEVGFVWLTNNAEPAVDPVTRRIALQLDMRGIA